MLSDHMGAVWLELKLFPAFQHPELYKGFLNVMGGNNNRSSFKFEFPVPATKTLRQK
jgi:hypothetical protein